MTYRAAPVTQRDGSELANSNCRMASGCSGIDYQTKGRIKGMGGAEMRERLGRPVRGDHIRRYKTGVRSPTARTS